MSNMRESSGASKLADRIVNGESANFVQVLNPDGTVPVQTEGTTETNAQGTYGTEVLAKRKKFRYELIVRPTDKLTVDEVIDIIDEIENRYPVMTAEFQRICIEQYVLFCLKQKNYGPTNISVGTRLETPDEKKLSLTGLWFRIHDKISRLKEMIIFGHKDSVNEPVGETFQDMSNYGIIGQLVERDVWAK